MLLLLLSFFIIFASSLFSPMSFFPSSLVLLLLHPFFNSFNLWAHTELSVSYVETARAEISHQRKK